MIVSDEIRVSEISSDYVFVSSLFFEQQLERLISQIAAPGHVQVVSFRHNVDEVVHRYLRQS